MPRQFTVNADTLQTIDIDPSELEAEYATARTEDFMDPPPDAPEGSAAGRFLSNAGEMLNPITIAQGLYQTVRHPIDTASNILTAQGQQFSKAGEAFGEGRYWEAAGHAGAGALPVLGPIAAEVGEQIASGDVAGGFGKAAGILAPVAAPSAVRAGVRAAKKVAPQAAAAAATKLEQGARSRVADVMSPKVGREKVRRGNQADRIAPDIAKDMAKDGAPLTRDTFHADISGRHQAARQALDEAADARLSAQTFETQPIIDALLEKRRQLTAESVDASRPVRAADGPPVRGARAPEEFQASGSVSTPDIPSGQRGFRTMDTGEFAQPRMSSVPVGRDVVPGPNAARVAVLDQAIEEISRLGPVARYEPIRRIRQAYDGQAETVYSPSVTQDFLKAQGGKHGAADVTGVLREKLAQWDPETAAANTQYSLYRTADDLLKAVAETERARPRVGRQIMARLTGVVFGGQQAGAAGAVAGYVGAPILDAALASGFTTQLKTAALMQRLADAIRAGDMSRVNNLTTLLQRELKTTGAVQAQRTTNPSGSQTGPELAPVIP